MSESAQAASPVEASESVETVEQVDSHEVTESSAEGHIEAQGESQEVAEEKPVSRKRKVKIKVDGQEEEVDFDPDNEDEIRKHLQMSKAAMKKMSEASKVKKQAESFMEKLKNDPRSVLEDPSLGVDFRKVAEEFLYEQIQRESMSPEEIEQQERMKRLEQYEAQEKTQKEQEESQRVTAMQQKYVQSYDKTITEALQSSGLPKTPSTVKRMAMMLSKNLELGLDLDPADLVDEVKKSYFSEFKEMFSASDADFVLSILGDDISNKIRKKDLEKLKSPNRPVQPAPRDVSAPKEPARNLSPDEWREMLDRKLGQ